MLDITFACAILAFSQVAVTVEIEEIVTQCASPNNGAGPFWCYGSPLIFRHGDDVFVSAMETGENIPPLCNTRWRIFRKHADGPWEMVQAAEKFNQREPCPLIGFPDGRIFLSVNPSTQPPGAQYGPCDPHLLEFSASDPKKPGIPVRPIWDEDVYFTDHSYRGVAADGPKEEILFLNIHARNGDQYWSYLDSSGNWTNKGRIKFPIRSCYPQVALRDGAGYVLAIGDIVEPVEEWRKYKFEKTGASWDYVFRRLFYTWAPDIAKSGFVEPIEIESLETTAGHMSNLDLWIDDKGGAHILYLKRTVQSNLMRDRFFPDTPITTSLEYLVIKDGQIIKKNTLFKGGEGLTSETPGYARFHEAEGNRLFVVYYSNGNQNGLLQILPEGDHKPVLIPLKQPFGLTFTALQRGGSKASNIVDLFGPGSGNSLRYARIKIND
ncbi:hypothetical protein FJZ33_04045 [Candidatus Poribacteria bacterium]|nr:hypothetical protein [Candidatus Poribacteria bacterium]